MRLSPVLVSRRWRLLGILALVLALGGAAAAWSSRFPAASERVAGTPFRLEVQDGVPAEHVEGIRTGLVAMDRYLREHVGAGVAGTVVVRVSWSDGCRIFLGPASLGTGWAEGEDFICINAAHPQFAQRTEGHGYFPSYVAAHEHVHNLQSQLGCARDEDDHEWQWLFEGMAVELAFRALVADGHVSPSEAELAVWEYRGLQTDNGTLADYERSSDAAGDAYGLFQLGAREALDNAGSPEAAADFCRAVAGGTPWRSAFATAFGLEVSELYRRVETEREVLRQEYAELMTP